MGTPMMEKEALNITRSPKGFGKVQGEIKRKQRPCVKLHKMEEISVFLYQNSLITELCFTLLN